MDKKWRGKIADGWMLSEDAARDEAASGGELKAPDKEALPPEQGERLYPLVLRRLRQVSDAAPLSLMARLPAPGKRTGSIPPNLRKPPYGQTVQAFLEALTANQPHLRHKWREGILLLSDPVALLEDSEEARVPWAVFKELRAAREAAPSGLLSLAHLFSAARQLTPPQLQHLGDDEFPQLREVAQWHDLYRRLERAPEILERLYTERGAPLSIVASALRTNPRMEPLLQNPDAAYVRLITRHDDTRQPPVRLMHLHLFTKEGAPASPGFLFAVEGVPAERRTEGKQ